MRINLLRIMTSYERMLMTQRIACLLLTVVMATAYGVEDSKFNETLSAVEGYHPILRCRIPDVKSSAIRWIKDGEVLRTGRSYPFGTIHKATGGLAIAIAKPSHAGNYTCYANNKPRLGTYSYLIIFVIKPVVSVVSAYPVNEVEGGNFSIVCRATGKPRPKFEWFTSRERKVKVKDLQASERIYFENTYIGTRTVQSKLVVTHVLPMDRGQFKCLASNDPGSIRQTINVDVQFAPKLVTSNTTVEAYWWEGARVNLTCSSIGNPVPVITWSPSHAISPVGSAKEGIVVSSTLWFSKATDIPEEPSVFRCRAENPHGQIEVREFSIRQVYKPPTPIVSVISVRDDEIKLSISMPWREATPTPTYVLCDYQRQSTPTLMNAGTSYTGNGTELNLRGVVLDRIYSVKVKVKNMVGYSNDTEMEILAEKFSIYDTTTRMTTQEVELNTGQLSDLDGRDNNNNNDENVNRSGANVGGNIASSLGENGDSNAAMRCCDASMSVLALQSLVVVVLGKLGQTYR